MIRHYFSVIEGYEDLDGHQTEKTIWTFREKEDAERLIGFLKERSAEYHDLYVEDWSLGEATT